MRVNKDGDLISDWTICDCSCQGNKVQLILAGQRFDIGAEIGERPNFELSILQCAEEDDEGCNFIERIVYQHDIKLSDEEYDAAQEFSYEDIEFEARIDGLMSARMAKDIFKYCLTQIEKTLFYSNILKGSSLDSTKYEKKWDKYFKYLLHERMEGRTIAPYIPGYEPKEV